MSYTIFRILVLMWNNSPEFLRRILTATGLPKAVGAMWQPYRDLPIPPTEVPVKGLIEKIVQRGWVCADVGGNYGMMTEAMAGRVGSSGHVTAFEAHPFNAKILRQRMQLKGFGKVVTVENKAVSDGKQKSLWLYPGRRSSPNEWNVVGHDVAGNRTKAEIEIPAIGLDDYFGKKPLNFVKIDVEGAEGSVIAGMREILKNQKPVFIIEFHNPEVW